MASSWSVTVLAFSDRTLFHPRLGYGMVTAVFCTEVRNAGQAQDCCQAATLEKL